MTKIHVQHLPSDYEPRWHGAIIDGTIHFGAGANEVLSVLVADQEQRWGEERSHPQSL